MAEIQVSTFESPLTAVSESIDESIQSSKTTLVESTDCSVPTVDSAEEQKRIDDGERQYQALKHKDYAQDIDHRKELANKTFNLIINWMKCLGAMLFLQGFPAIFGLKWALADNVMITLLTTTTVTVLGLVAIVLRYFFKGQNGNAHTGES